jgi:pSer/pThr/pTyr-binding forkhead associated (FHA) protein
VLSGTPGNFPINPGGELLVGRDSARCQVILQEPRVSAAHAAIRFDGSQIFVRDLGSNNGTLVNGNRIAPNIDTPVPPGSILRFGPVEFVLRLE